MPRPSARLLRAAAITLVVAAAALLVAGRVVATRDAEHARLYYAGQTIGGFLDGYCAAVRDASRSGSSEPMERPYADDYRSDGRGRWHLGAPLTLAGAAVRPWHADGTADYGRVELFAELSAYLAGLVSVDKASCKIGLIEDLSAPGPERLDGAPGEYGAAVLTAKMVLSGVDTTDQLFQDQLTLRWHLSKSGDLGYWSGWRIQRDALVEGRRVSGDGQAFINPPAAALGVDFVHQRNPKLDPSEPGTELPFGVIQHSAGGVTAADYDGDGRPDLFFPDGRRARLYRNSGVDPAGLPVFVDVTRESGLDGIDQANAGLFADMDNDGDRDLLVIRYLAANRYFENDGHGRFTDRSADMGFDLVAPSMAATLVDYDRDGYLDVYLAVYGNAFETFPRIPFFAQNGDANRLLHNDDGAGFTDVTQQSGTGDTGWSMAAVAGDTNGDGWADLAVANDFGRKNLYVNQRDGTFREAAKEAGVLDFSGGMGLALGDFDDDGLVDLYTSNIQSNQRWFGEQATLYQYMRNVVRTRWAVLDLGEYWTLYGLLGSEWERLGREIGEGNSLFANNGDGTFRELKESHTERAGWGWGIAFLDYDNDADLDIYAANGWISNTPNTDL